MLHFWQGARCFLFVLWLYACSCCNVRQDGQVRTEEVLKLNHPSIVHKQCKCIANLWKLGEPKQAGPSRFWLSIVVVVASSSHGCWHVSLVPCASSFVDESSCHDSISLNIRFCGCWIVRCISYICKHNPRTIMISTITCAYILITTLWDGFIDPGILDYTSFPCPSHGELCPRASNF